MKNSRVIVGFSTTPEFAEQVRAAAKASNLTVSKWVYGVVQEAVKNKLAVRELVTYEVVDPKPAVIAAQKRRA